MRALAELPDGRIASASDEDTIKLWRNQTCEATLAGHTNWVYCLAVLSDGTLASGSGDNTIKLWNTKDGACVRTFEQHTGGVSALAVLKTGTRPFCGRDGK